MSRVYESYRTGTVLKFEYNGGRIVMGEVLRDDHDGVLIKLYTDYLGKNDNWYAGEQKYVMKGAMKNVKTNKKP